MKFKLWLIILLFSASKLSAQTKFISSDTASYFKLMFVGDVSLTKEVLDVSYSERKQQYDFQYLFHYIRPVLNLADLVVGNVENTYGIKKDYLKNELNAAPEEFAVALKYAGFNLLMNANRTAIAQESDSWKQNRDFLESLHITQIGSFENEEDRYRRNPSIIEKNGLKVAFLNYFYGIPYYPELKPLVNGFQEDVVERDIVLAKNRGADYIIVYMNWGSEYELDANATQKKIGDFCIQAGANLVVGTHPHVVQEASVKNVKNAKGIHQTVIAYSLGDFISTTSAPLQNGACILELILKKSKASGLTSIADLSYIPTYTAMYQEGEFLRYAIMPVSQVEKANLNVPIDNTEKRWMSSAAEKVRYKFKGQIDEIEYELDDEIIDDVAEVLSITRRPLNEGKDFTLGINNHLLQGLSEFMGEKEEIANKPIVYEGIVYKIQFLSLRREIPIDLDFYKHLKGYEVYFQDEYYNYVIGNFRNLKQANDFCLDVKRNGHKYAYVVAFENGVPKKVVFMNCIVDRGNTKTKIYFFEKNDLKASLAFMNEEEDAILKALQNDFDKILVSASGNLPNFLVQLRSDQINLSSSTALPIRLNYSSLESLGSDRIALSVGAAFLYPQRNVLVVSAGTCITYDLLDEAGVFQGGLIAPGAAIRLKSLHEYTYSLPSLTFEPKENVPLIGKTTKECMESGVYNGIKAELSAIIQTFNENYKDLTVIITGGDGILFDFHMKNKIFAQQNLQAIGLNRILLYNAS